MALKRIGTLKQAFEKRIGPVKKGIKKDRDS